jgi:signal transduction histidine kinase
VPQAALHDADPDVRLLAIRHRAAGAGATVSTKSLARGFNLTIRFPIAG